VNLYIARTISKREIMKKANVDVTTHVKRGADLPVVVVALREADVCTKVNNNGYIPATREKHQPCEIPLVILFIFYFFLYSYFFILVLLFHSSFHICIDVSK
jgi:hypothetical protein